MSKEKINKIVINKKPSNKKAVKKVTEATSKKGEE